ncbi:unnamed protein product [Rhizopus microsporus]
MDEYGFETRLRHLEYVLFGQQQQQQQQQLKSPDDAIVQRLGKLNRKLQFIYQKHKPIEYFMEKYDTHSKLLNPNTSTYSMERELLSTNKFAQEVKQVKSLQHVVNGTDFDVVDELKPKLSELDIVHVDQTKQLNKLTREISELMERYNKTVNTVSEIFIAWDNILTSIETHVTNMEHQKQN